ncbi:MAG: hypothetical protein WCK76_09860, partial [Elusimicrobiota bacterium]
MRYKIKFPRRISAHTLIRLVILPAFFLSSIVGSAAAGSTFGITAIGSTGYPTAKAVTSNAGAAIDTAQSKFGGASGQFVSASSQYLS